jgi:hypothetical protein
VGESNKDCRNREFQSWSFVLSPHKLSPPHLSSLLLSSSSFLISSFLPISLHYLSPRPLCPLSFSIELILIPFTFMDSHSLHFNWFSFLFIATDFHSCSLSKSLIPLCFNGFSFPWLELILILFIWMDSHSLPVNWFSFRITLIDSHSLHFD